MSKRAVRKVQKQIEEQAALRERLLEKLDSVLQTGRIKELEGAISASSPPCSRWSESRASDRPHPQIGVGALTDADAPYQDHRMLLLTS